MSVYVIAEVGINHNGNPEIAKEMIRTAKDAGADCVKFQTFKAEEFISDKTQTFTYKSQGREVTESMYEMFKRYEFSDKDWEDIISYCNKYQIDFSSTPQNLSDLEFLMSKGKLTFIKVGSDDLTNLELLKAYASYKIPMIISAGMAYAYEIEDAIRVITDSGNNNLTVLHCISSYPADAKEVNLNKLETIKRAFGVEVGFSDHTIGNVAAIGAVCFGAKVIEKHFTLSCDLPGPDHWFSIDKKGLYEYVKDIRFAEKMLGTPILGQPKKN